MANEELMQSVKRIQGLMRAGNRNEAYDAYREVFSAPAFMTYRPIEQRQVLRLMVLVKDIPLNPTNQMVEAHRAAIAPLTQLISTQHESSDYELLGICYVIVEDNANAMAAFRAGLAIERATNPQSDLCAAFMRRISIL